MLAGCGDNTASDPVAEGDATPSQVPTMESLTELDAENFGYTGGCGWEAVAEQVKMADGTQQNSTASYQGATSTARVTGSEVVEVDGREVALVDMECTVSGGDGEESYAAVHLLGLVDDRPIDLGIVALGEQAEVRLENGGLRGSETYRSTFDGSETTNTFDIVLAGHTPVRVGDGPQAAEDRFRQVPDWASDLPARGYDEGLVAVELPGPDPASELNQRWVVGVLVDAEHVLVGREVSDCEGVTVHTEAGEALRVADAGAVDTGVSALRLSEASAGAPTAETDALPTEEPMLVAAPNGRAPSVAVPLDEQHGQPRHETATASYEWMDHPLDRSNQLNEDTHRPEGSAAIRGPDGVAGLGTVSFPTGSGFDPTRGVVELDGHSAVEADWVCEGG